MYLLNYLYFLIITYYGIRFLFQPIGIMKSPLNKEQSMLLEGPEMFWILTFSTGLLAFSAPGALDLMAVRLLILEALCIIGLFLSKGRVIWSLPLIIYIIYIIWIILGIFYSPAPSYGFRVVLKYCYPLLVALFASSAVKDKEVFLKAGIGARWVAILSFSLILFPFLESSIFPGVFWYGTARAINYISMCIFSLALFFYTNEKKKNLILFFLFIFPCFYWVFRTSIMGTTAAICCFFFFKYKLKSLPVLLGIFLLFIISIFTIPSLHDKMFRQEANISIENLQNNQISSENIDANGRFAMWEWSIDRFFHGKELRGSGTGNIQETFYSLRHPFSTIKIIHNDYVQILCDNGLIGITLFGCSFLFLIFHCFIVYQNKAYPTAVHICAITAGASTFGVLLTLYTDNVINYSMATISYPCGFYGMMLGMISKYKNHAF